MSEKIVVALGGNAILTDDPSAQGQINTLRKSAQELVKLIEKGYEIVVTHGNGPQVGNLLLQNIAADSKENPQFPLDSLVAMTQGSIGYWIQTALSEALRDKGIEKDVAAVLTRVEVSKDDPAFSEFTKPIGPFYTKDEAEEISSKTGDKFIEDAGRGYRKVVASPQPVDIVDSKAVSYLMDNGEIAIACGGGGIPVIKEDGRYVGVEAVIDKDFASAKLAELIGADILFILTGVDNVYIDFNQPNQKKLEEVTVSEMKKYIEEGHFAPGSMLPKVKAAINFIESNPHGKAIITSLENIDAFFNGGSMTVVVAD